MLDLLLASIALWPLLVAGTVTACDGLGGVVDVEVGLAHTAWHHAQLD